MTKSWSPTSWKAFQYMQHVEYPSDIHLENTLRLLRQMPPLVTVGEVTDLKAQLKQAAVGNAFLLQGGDCAESFASCDSQSIRNKVNLLAQMGLVLSTGLSKPVIHVGRIAGQFAKPRSALTETKDDTILPSYRGDLINSSEFSAAARQPNPTRMLDGYRFSAITLNYIRGLLSDNHKLFNQRLINELQLTLNGSSESFNQRQPIIDSLKLLGALCEHHDKTADELRFFISHEAMHLPYEAALTRHSDGKWYNLSTHYPWVGYRTAKLDSAHIEYLSGIANPVAVKLGPTATEDYVLALIERLNPKNELGKVSLVTRFGSKRIESVLPRLIKAVQLTQKNVVWICDPMHGNTKLANNGYKTRHVDDVFSELELAQQIHHAHQSILGGVHLELTGEHVTECLGGIDPVMVSDLPKHYKSLVDPRLNKEQALQLAFEYATHAKQNHLKPLTTLMPRVVGTEKI